MKKHASGYWYKFLLPRKITIKPTRLWRWLNFYWRFPDSDKENIISKTYNKLLTKISLKLFY